MPFTNRIIDYKASRPETALENNLSSSYRDNYDSEIQKAWEQARLTIMRILGQDDSFDSNIPNPDGSPAVVGDPLVGRYMHIWMSYYLQNRDGNQRKIDISIDNVLSESATYGTDSRVYSALVRETRSQLSEYMNIQAWFLSNENVATA